MAKEQSKLTQQVQEQFWFLFGERNGQIVANKDTGHLSKLRSPVVTVAVDGLLFRFVHWRDNRQVYVASERLPDEWHELSAILKVMEPDKVRRHSVIFFLDAARLLRDHLDRVKEAFSPDRYPQVRELQLPSVRIHKRNLLKPRVLIRSYNDHGSAPFSRALVGWRHQSLIGRGSRHCYGINFTNNPLPESLRTETRGKELSSSGQQGV